MFQVGAKNMGCLIFFNFHVHHPHWAASQNCRGKKLSCFIYLLHTSQNSALGSMLGLYWYEKTSNEVHNTSTSLVREKSYKKSRTTVVHSWVSHLINYFLQLPKLLKKTCANHAKNLKETLSTLGLLFVYNVEW
jgi:hypothetical protein